MATTKRPLNRIAAEVMVEWTNVIRHTNRRPAYMVHAWPYLDAMLQMDDIAKPYGLEEGVFVVLYFLNNATPWRGEVAKRIKAELNQQVKDYNAAHTR